MDAIAVTHDEKLISPTLRQNGRYHYNFTNKFIFFSDDECTYQIGVRCTNINYDVPREHEPNYIHNMEMQNGKIET